MTLWTKLVLWLVCALLAVTAIAVQTARLSKEQAAHARTKESFAAARLAAEQDAALRLKAQQVTVDSARRTLDEARIAIRRKDADLASARTDVSRLREQLSAAGRVSPASTTPCQCAALGDLAAEGVGLLERGSGLLRSCSADHDERAVEVRALVEAWPR